MSRWQPLQIPLCLISLKAEEYLYTEELLGTLQLQVIVERVWCYRRFTRGKKEPFVLLPVSILVHFMLNVSRICVLHMC